MKIFVTLLFMFILGSMCGYVIEVFFRRFVSMKRWINPGLLKGPRLPIYGLGLVFLFVFSHIFDYSGVTHLNYVLVGFIVTMLFGTVATLLEYVGGIIFIKKMNIKLWDYSNMKGNIQGVICPLFTLMWTVIGAFYFFVLKIPFDNFFSLVYDYMFVSQNIWLILLIGAIYGLIIGDFISVVKPITLISRSAKAQKYIVEWENIKLDLSKKKKELNSSSTLIQIDEFISKAKAGLIKPLTRIKSHLVIDPNKENKKE